MDALKQVLTIAKLAAFNTDQGSQFTSYEFTGLRQHLGVKISMDGKGRWMDNVMIEQRWRSLKYEDIYLKQYQTVDDLYDGLNQYFQVYNHERFHQSLDYRTPYQVYSNTIPRKEALMLG